MRAGFENYLHQLNDLSKDMSREDLSETERDKLSNVLDWHISKAAQRYGTPKETQEFVFEMQEKKRLVMDRLKERLRNIDNPFTERQPEARPVKCKEGKYLCSFKDDEIEVTAGEILTDVEWGLSYELDQKTMPKTLCKRYWVEVAKKELLEILNEQITENEVQYLKSRGDAFKAYAYGELRHWEQNSEDPSISGQYAEREIRNFLRKVAIDLGGEFKVAQGDAHQDVEQKIDFVLIMPAKGRGFSVDKKSSAKKDSEDKKYRLGIQFTINADQERVVHKQKQIQKSKASLAPTDKIDDIVLVQMDLKRNWQLVNQWIKNGKPPGGPEKEWSDYQKAYALINMLSDFLTANKIDSLLNKFGIPRYIVKEVKEKIHAERATGQPGPKNASESIPPQPVKKINRILSGMIFSHSADGKKFTAVSEYGKIIELDQGQNVKPGHAYKIKIINDSDPKSLTEGKYLAIVLERERGPAIQPKKNQSR